MARIHIKVNSKQSVLKQDSKQSVVKQDVLFWTWCNPVNTIYMFNGHDIHTIQCPTEHDVNYTICQFGNGIKSTDSWNVKCQLQVQWNPSKREPQ